MPRIQRVLYSGDEKSREEAAPRSAQPSGTVAELESTLGNTTSPSTRPDLEAPGVVAVSGTAPVAPNAVTAQQEAAPAVTMPASAPQVVAPQVAKSALMVAQPDPAPQRAASPVATDSTDDATSSCCFSPSGHGEML